MDSMTERLREVARLKVKHLPAVLRPLLPVMIGPALPMYFTWTAARQVAERWGLDLEDLPWAIDLEDQDLDLLEMRGPQDEEGPLRNEEVEAIACGTIDLGGEG